MSAVTLESRHRWIAFARPLKGQLRPNRHSRPIGSRSFGSLTKDRGGCRVEFAFRSWVRISLTSPHAQIDFRIWTALRFPLFWFARGEGIKMKRAWVITQEGTRHAQEVIGILSARKSGRTVKEYVEWLHALLNYYPNDHLNLAKYNNPTTLDAAEFTRTNTGVPVENVIFCGHNPHLVARLAKDIELVDADGERPLLKWTNPNRLICDARTLQITEKVPGAVCEAPVNLPFRRRAFDGHKHAPYLE
jgi:hypothetical protein